MSEFDRGSIFLSHASGDKHFVEQVYERLDTSSAFYDIRTVQPGQAFIDAMKNGIKGKNLFVLFHSPNTKNTWVEYELQLAELNQASRHARILVVPLSGETHETLPDWMKRFMTCSHQFSISDVVRQIQFIQNQLIEEISGQSSFIVGREDLQRHAHIQSLKNVQETGSPVQHVIFSGLPGMGRKTFANQYILKSLSGLRPGGPVFSLPDMAEAVDFYLAMKQDIGGILSQNDVEKQIDAFRELAPPDQAKLVIELSKHWAELNQPIIISTKLGLRDRSRKSKPWLEQFFKLSSLVPSLRIIYISERQLPEEVVIGIPNLTQFHIGELSAQDIQYILGELINPRYFDAARSEKLSTNIHGHPATAHYVAKFINSGKTLDTLNENPEPIYSFQERILGGILSEDLISSTQREILALLGIFPRLSFGILVRVFGIDSRELALQLWDLQEASLISVAGSEYYSSPSVVANRARKELSSISRNLLEKVRKYIQEDLEIGKLDSQLIDALLIASITPTGEVPKELDGLVTSSSLLTLVIDRFYQARDATKGSRDIYLSAYNLSKLALTMETSDDAVEQILFTGGDSAIRAGVYPSDIIDRMMNAALPSVYYLKGSYYFHVVKDDLKAAENFKISLSMKHFKLRNVRLLARALIRAQDFSGALDALNSLSDQQLERETGLMIQKIRAYRGLRSHAEADALEKKIQGRDDEYGEIHIFNAGRALQESRLDDALIALQKAENLTRVNRFTLQLLRCAVLIEKGDASLLPLTVETANSVNRAYDADQLQARNAVVQGRWADAERFLNKITKKDYFDLQIARRMLHLKMEDPEIIRDAVALAKCQDDLEEIARLSTRAPAGFRNA